MTFTRKLVKGSNVYVYEVRSYSDRDTGRVRQDAKYIGKEVEKNGKKILIPPVDRKGVRMVFDSGAYVLYSTAHENGILWQLEDVLDGFTRIRDAAKKIVILAAESVMGPGHSIFIHTGITEMSYKDIRDVIDLVGRKNPDTVAMLERSIAPLILREFSSSGIVYDLSAIRYYGNGNGLARYGHYYHLNKWREQGDKLPSGCDKEGRYTHSHASNCRKHSLYEHSKHFQR